MVKWFKYFSKTYLLIVFYQLILPAQVNPSPLYPVLHVQVKLPSVLAQTAFALHGVDRHSLISVKCYKGYVSSVKAWLSQCIDLNNSNVT